LGQFLLVLLTKRARGDEMKVGSRILRRTELFEGDELVGRILLWLPLGRKGRVEVWIECRER
jgi:hypothetical protein